MQKKVTLSIFIFFILAIFLMGILEVASGAIAGTIGKVVSYVILAAILIYFLLRMGKKEEAREGENEEDDEHI